MVEPQSTKIDHIRRILSSLHVRFEEQGKALKKLAELEEKLSSVEGLDGRVKELLAGITDDLGELEGAERSQRELSLVKQKIEDMRIMVYPAREVGLAFAAIQHTDLGKEMHSGVSTGYVKLTGYTEHELKRMSWRMVVPKADAKAFILHQKKRKADPTLPEWYKINIIKKDGTRVPVRAGLASTSDGREITYNGKKAAVVYLTPIDEIETLERKLAFAKNLKSTIDTLMDTLGGLCHDMNQPLTSLYGLFDMYSLAELAKDPDHEEVVRAEVKRLFDLVQELNTFAQKRPTEEAGYINIGKMLVEDVFPSFRYKMDEEGISLQYEMADGCVAFVKKRGMTRAFTNVMMNAYEAIQEAEEKGTPGWAKQKSVHVSVRRTACEIVVDITDSGVGSDDLTGGGTAELKIFQPHYSTKDMGRKVSGLGLAVAYSMVKENNGDIIGISEGSGRGATFRITLPYLPKVDEKDTLRESVDGSKKE